ncbi:TIGR03618 family F420-dependent PPOX class oxidoreductase [Gordonia sp. SID5947]|uniref:PPOX class F420-dependent oxidoreductase n=1 Tax=Gordonia sp. SID5947 TaxID=2690315 RepID=UPI00136FA232|nr:PPOX class F420-dependent oxidoreductase [Gordonia sp. SID5947]MYR08274.1 TIGR03618 family F420-dependent PPOX class oxidoreductase [Gordonia sp. SID5947]
MSRPPLPDAAKELLAKANPCVMATLRSDGAPVSAATWYLLDGERVLLSMDNGRVRLEHLRRDPRVTLTVLDDESWYTHVTLLGRVVEFRDDEGLVDIDRISRLYTGGAYPDRERPRTTAVVEIERWHGWGSMKDNEQAGG